MRTGGLVLLLVLGAALAAGSALARDDKPARADAATDATTAGAEKAPRPAAPRAADGHREGRGSGSQDGRTAVRVSPIFRDVTDDDIADIMKFIDANMPWYRPDLDKMRESDADHFRQVCRHLRFETAQLRELKEHDPEGFRKAIEEKQLKFRAQDLAAKARAATDPRERDGFMEQLRQVVQRLVDAEVATREAVIAQLEQRLDALRQELKDRAAKRDEIVKARIDDMLKGKKEEGKFKGDKTDKGDRGERAEKGEKPDNK